MVAFGDSVFKISDQGYDIRKLGQWSYITSTNKNNITTAMTTCYCPCRGASPGSVYAQRLLYMSENAADTPENIKYPRRLFGHNLIFFFILKLKMDTN